MCIFKNSFQAVHQTASEYEMEVINKMFYRVAGVVYENIIHQATSERVAKAKIQSNQSSDDDG